MPAEPLKNARDANRRRKLAVVLLNLGGPDGPDAVRPFLQNLFSDPAIIGLPGLIRRPLAAYIARQREHEARANYAHMGGGSPLLPETEKQAEALIGLLADRIDGAETRVFIGMRYWRPFTEETARVVAAWAPDDVVLLPLYPQFSTTTTASSLKAWRSAFAGDAPVRAICCWPTEPGFAEAHAALIARAWDAAGQPLKARLLFSAHGLPEKIVLGGDPYQWQVERTAEAIVERLPERPDGGAWDWQVCYQSRVGPLKWIGPSTPEAIAEAATGAEGVIVSPIAFVSEHVETLVELDRDYAALAERVNLRPYIRVPALGIEPRFVEQLADLVAGALDKPAGVAAACGTRICPERYGRCPMELAA